LFLGDFGTGYKIEITGDVVDNGIIDFDINIENVQVGNQQLDKKILEMQPAFFDPPWAPSLKVKLEIDNPNDYFSFAHPYTYDIGSLDLLKGQTKPFIITVRHLEPGDYTATLYLVQGSLFSGETIHDTVNVNIEILDV
jgi:hypothetical protein